MGSRCFVEGCANAPAGKCRVCGRKACSAHGATRGDYFYCRNHKKGLLLGFDALVEARRGMVASKAAAASLRHLDEIIAIARDLDASAIEAGADPYPAAFEALDWIRRAGAAEDAGDRGLSEEALRAAFEALSRAQRLVQGARLSQINRRK